MKHSLRLAVFLLLAFAALAGAAEPTPPFKLWKDVASPEIRNFKPPEGQRFELPNGMIIFLLEDHELPLIDVSLLLRVGEIHEPPELTGLASAVAAVMRSGGSAAYPGDKLDETLENMASELTLSADREACAVHLHALKENFDQSLGLLADVLRQPLFPKDKLELYLGQARVAVAQRNDKPDDIAGREFRKALYGATSPFARVAEYATLARLDRKALRDFHAKYFHPNRFIVGVTGDFKQDEMRAKLAAAFGSWPKEEVKLPDIEPIRTTPQAQTLFVEQPQLNQTTIMLGHVLDLRYDHPDYPALWVAVEALGGGMDSRLFNNIRSRQGLAYTVRGMLDLRYDRPGGFVGFVRTRNGQALEALAALRAEIARLQAGGITQKELDGVREMFVNTYVFRCDTPAKIVNREMRLEFYGYPQDFDDQVLAAVRQVSVEAVNRAAKQYLDPDHLIVVGVGATAGLDPARSFLSVPGVQKLDVTIPAAKE